MQQTLKINFGYLKMTLFLSVFCFFAQNLAGQTQNELGVHLKGPVSVLSYDNVNQKNDVEDGIGFGIDYGYYFSDTWSFRTGIGYQTYKGRAFLERLSGSYQTIDPEGESFEFRYDFDNYSEEQKASYLQLPLLLQYETPGKNRFFIAGGVTLGLNIDGSYQASASALNTAGYYEQYEVVLQAPLFAGFGDFGSYESPEGNLDLGFNAMLSLETGFKIAVALKQALYVGVYLDYGLSSVLDQNATEPLLVYQPNAAREFQNTGILSAATSTDGTFVGDVNTFSFGIKARYAFGF